jgi:shikimate kinase
LDVDALHTHESAYAQNLLEKSGEFIANLAASVGDNPELLNKFKAETTIYLHTSLEDQLLHSGTRGVGRQALVNNREEEIRSRYDRRDPRFREVATFVAQASRDRNKDAQTILEFLKGQE